MSKLYIKTMYPYILISCRLRALCSISEIPALRLASTWYVLLQTLDTHSHTSQVVLLATFHPLKTVY